MPYFRLSRARYHYRCARCEAGVRKGQRYFRDEPVGGEFVGIRHRSIFGSREPGVPRDVVAMA